MREPLSKRRALLRQSFMEKEGEFLFARSLDSDSTDTIEEFLEQSIRGACVCFCAKERERDVGFKSNVLKSFLPLIWIRVTRATILSHPYSATISSSSMRIPREGSRKYLAGSLDR